MRFFLEHFNPERAKQKLQQTTLFFFILSKEIRLDVSCESYDSHEKSSLIFFER